MEMGPQRKGSRIQAHHVHNERRGQSALLLSLPGSQLSSLHRWKTAPSRSLQISVQHDCPVEQELLLNGPSGNTELTTLEWRGSMGPGQPVGVSRQSVISTFRHKYTRKSLLLLVPTISSSCVTWSQTFSEPSLLKGRGSSIENSRF